MLFSNWLCIQQQDCFSDVGFHSQKCLAIGCQQISIINIISGQYKRLLHNSELWAHLLQCSIILHLAKLKTCSINSTTFLTHGNFQCALTYHHKRVLWEKNGNNWHNSILKVKGAATMVISIHGLHLQQEATIVNKWNKALKFSSCLKIIVWSVSFTSNVAQPLCTIMYLQRSISKKQQFQSYGKCCYWLVHVGSPFLLFFSFHHQ